MVKYNGRKIIYTFKYGTCFSTWVKIIYFVGAVFLLVLGITPLIAGYSEAVFFTYISCIAGSILLAVSIYYFCKTKHIDRDISEWLKDEHLFGACAEAYEFDESWYRGYVSYKLGISFKNKGEKYRQYTSRNESAWRFKKISNLVKSNNLDILYSPKYGEVMVLAEQDK